MAKRATINMIAQKAGVSRGTVDRVLNQRPHVSKDVYDRVVKAIKELNYIPPSEQQAQALGLAKPASVHTSCKLGILLPNWQGHFKKEIMRGISDARKQLALQGAEIIIEACETDLPYEAIERIETLIKQDVSGIAMCSNDHYTIVEKVNELSSQGIPVVTFNSDLTNSERLCYVGQDVLKCGRVAGELMAKCLRRDDRLLIAIGNFRFNGHRMRMQGFCQRMRESQFKSELLKVIETYNDYTISYQKILDELEKSPDIRGIYMANHSVTGCADAIKKMGRQGEIFVISHDLTEETKRLLRRKEIDFTIAQDIYSQGFQPPLILYEYFMDHTLPKKSAISPAIEILCSENFMSD